jgi:hypothetical protein
MDVLEVATKAEALLAALLTRPGGFEPLMAGTQEVLALVRTSVVTSTGELARFNEATRGLARDGELTVKEGRLRHDRDVRDYGRVLRDVAELCDVAGFPHARAAVLGEALCVRRGLLSDTVRQALTSVDLLDPAVVSVMEVAHVLESEPSRLLVRVYKYTRSRVLESGRVSEALSVVAPGAVGLLEREALDYALVGALTPEVLETLVVLVGQNGGASLADLAQAATEL